MIMATQSIASHRMRKQASRRLRKSMRICVVSATEVLASLEDVEQGQMFGIDVEDRCFRCHHITATKYLICSVMIRSLRFVYRQHLINCSGLFSAKLNVR